MLSSSDTKLLRTSAFIAGLGLLIMVVAASFAEMYVYPKIVVPFKADETIKYIIAHKQVFISCILAYFITFVCDIIVAWALYFLLKKVNERISLLMALFRLVYAVLVIAALFNLISVLQLANSYSDAGVAEHTQIYLLTGVYLDAFKNNFSFSLILFGIHLLLLGYLVFVSKYIPRIIGILLLIAGAGYVLSSLKSYLFPQINLDFAKYTFFGEIVFMFWLLFKGLKISIDK